MFATAPAPTLTNGIEFKRFYLDKKAWPDDLWAEDELIYVDNEIFEGPYIRIPDKASVRIKGGYIQSKKQRAAELLTYEQYFLEWRKRQAEVVIVACVAPDKAEAVTKAILAAGGRLRPDF
jgi:hypothetical protein